MKRDRILWILAVFLLLTAVLLLSFLILFGSAPAAQTTEAAETSAVSATPDEVDAARSEETPAPSLETTPDTDAALEAEIRARIPDTGECWDILVESLDGARRAVVTQNLPEDHRMVSASLIKLFVMGAVYQAHEEGQLDAVAQQADLRSMITVSDNSAANRLIALLGGGDADAGMARVNSFAQELGCFDTQLNRLMLVDNGLQNYTSARDCAIFLRAVVSGTCVSAERSKQMLELLRGQTVNNRLPLYLPTEASVAHKTGDLTHLSCGDVGIVFAPGGNYLLCAISNYSLDDARTAETIAGISQLVYQTMTASNDGREGN